MSYVIVILLMIAVAQIAGGLVGTFVALSGLKRIRVHSHESNPQAVASARSQGAKILRNSVICLVIGTALLSICLYLATVTA